MTRIALVAAVAIGTAAPAASGCQMETEAQSRLHVRRETTVSQTLRVGGGGPTVPLQSFNRDVHVRNERR